MEAIPKKRGLTFSNIRCGDLRPVYFKSLCNFYSSQRCGWLYLRKFLKSRCIFILSPRGGLWYLHVFFFKEKPLGMFTSALSHVESRCISRGVLLARWL